MTNADCNNVTETIPNLTSGCQVLAPDEYRSRHDVVAKILHISSFPQRERSATIRQ